jgi:hypothetical protein
MTDRYRIVKFTDGNEVTFYTIQIEVKWLFGFKFWRTHKSYSPDGSCSVTKMFDTLEAAQQYVRGSKWTNTVVEEGTL